MAPPRIAPRAAPRVVAPRVMPRVRHVHLAPLRVVHQVTQVIGPRVARCIGATTAIDTIDTTSTLSTLSTLRIIAGGQEQEHGSHGMMPPDEPPSECM